MWTLTTSTGLRVDGIKCEQAARRTVHMLGLVDAISHYSWYVVDNRGHRFVAELRKAA